MSNTVKIQTTRFGEREVDPSTFIHLFAGLVGFPQYTSFVKIDFDYPTPFSWLQSTESPELAFVIMSAEHFGDGYAFDLPVSDKELDLKEGDDVAIFNIVSIRPTRSESSVNLKAPVIVNLRNMKGRQVILDDPRFPTRMPLWADGDESTQDSAVAQPGETPGTNREK